jgi:hypothetical protein
MNAIEALKLANSRGSVAMLHAQELSIRRRQLTDQIANWHPLQIVAVGLGAGAVLGKLASRHPLAASLSTGVMAILRYAPADTLMRMFQQREEQAEAAAAGITEPRMATAAASSTEPGAADVRADTFKA